MIAPFSLELYARRRARDQRDMRAGQQRAGQLRHTRGCCGGGTDSPGDPGRCLACVQDQIAELADWIDAQPGPEPGEKIPDWELRIRVPCVQGHIDVVTYRLHPDDPWARPVVDQARAARKRPVLSGGSNPDPEAPDAPR